MDNLIRYLEKFDQRLAIELFIPAIGALKGGEVILDRKPKFIFYWFLPLLLTLSWAIVQTSSGLVPSDFGFFVLLVIIPSILVVYYVVWVRSLWRHIKKMDVLLRPGMIPMHYKAKRGLLLFTSFSFPLVMILLFSSIVVTGKANLLAQPLTSFSLILLAVVMATFWIYRFISTMEASHGNKSRLMTSLLTPVFGFQGINQILNGKWALGITILVLGWIFLIFMMGPHVISIDREYNLMFNYISYIAMSLYLLFWFVFSTD